MHPEPVETSSGYATRFQRLRAHPVLYGPVRFWSRHREQILFLVVGAWNTVFGYACWAFMQYLLGDVIPYLVVVVLAWPFAVLNAYLGYRYVVFRSRGPIRHELPRFSLVYLGTLGATLILLPIALSVLPLDIYLVQALLLAAIVVASYLAHKYFSFRSGRAALVGAGARAATSDRAGTEV